MQKRRRLRRGVAIVGAGKATSITKETTIAIRKGAAPLNMSPMGNT